MDHFGRRNLGTSGLSSSVKFKVECRSHKKDVLSDVNNANWFNPRLSEMIFAASVPRDASVQEYAPKHPGSALYVLYLTTTYTRPGRFVLRSSCLRMSMFYLKVACPSVSGGRNDGELVRHDATHGPQI